VWLSDDEFRRLSASAGAITFCPCSNLFLGSGLFRLGRATDPQWRVRLSFGTDVGGGNRFSMLNVLDDAYKIGMVNNARVDDPAEAERNKLSAYRGFWSITLGGAEGLYIDDLVGNFAPGKEADFAVLDANPLENIANTHNINKVYLRGAEVDRAALRAKFLAGTK